MLKVILVDDEKAGLRMLERRLSDYPEAQIEGVYTNPLVALEEIDAIKPQVVFLDIDMPQLQGLDAASVIKEKCPGTHIVFVTGYEEFAVDAFELEALDYLLKPVSKKRFSKTFERILLKIKDLASESGNAYNNGSKLEIMTMGKFEIVWSGKPLVKWRSKKTRELAAYLVHKQGRQISKDQLIEALWPDHDLSTATNQLYKNIHYIRKTLEESGINKNLIRLEGKYCLSIGPEVQQASLLFSTASSSVNKNTTLDALESIEKSYHGDFLEGEEGLWAHPERTRLLGVYNTIVIRLAEKYIELSQYEKAEKILTKAFNNSPCEECITLFLLKMYESTGQKTKSANHLDIYKDILNRELEVEPPDHIKNMVS